MTEVMGIRSGCTLSLPLTRIPPPLGSDQVPAARCVFSGAQQCSRAPRPAGSCPASFLFARRVVLGGIFMPVRHRKEMERLISVRSIFSLALRINFRGHALTALMIPILLARWQPIRTKAKPVRCGAPPCHGQGLYSALWGRWKILAEEFPASSNKTEVFSSCFRLLANLHIETGTQRPFSLGSKGRITPGNDMRTDLMLP
jgi:hypothetical protein